eukprot:Phypoly_transcript_17983.p1 GENE.Phypoly_transcript_17983~~Phypoly_transcript_17983.p1  ORF type:complete len:154 (+),score=32.19 Phypoly_transcript_17983:1-462(+)
MAKQSTVIDAMVKEEPSAPVFAVPSAPHRRKRNAEDVEQQPAPSPRPPLTPKKEQVPAVDHQAPIKTEENSHIIFIIDNSKSMSNTDVTIEHNRKVSRSMLFGIPACNLFQKFLVFLMLLPVLQIIITTQTILNQTIITTVRILTEQMTKKAN